VQIEPNIVIIHTEAGMPLKDMYAFILPDNGVPIFDINYDWKIQEQIRNTYLYISKNDGNELWPYLVNNIDDKRYSLTYAYDERVYNATVGDICKRIAYKDLICPYDQYLGRMLYDSINDSTKEKADIFTSNRILNEMFNKDNNSSNKETMLIPPRNMNDLKTWYSQRKNKQLYELQNGICNWAIERIKSSKIITDKVKTKYINRINDNINTITETKTPICIKRSPFNEDVSYFNESIAKQLREEYEAQLKATGGKDK
jgi:hypothetical protein